MQKDILDKIIKINKLNSDDYLSISPGFIGKGEKIVYDLETLNLYENMNENTKQFAEEKIVSKILDISRRTNESSLQYSFKLIFCGSLKEYNESQKDIYDFILEYKDRIVAIYKYVDILSNRSDIKVERTVYFNLGILLDMFKENDFDMAIGKIDDYYNHDDKLTLFTFKFDPNRDLESYKRILKK